MPASTHAVVNGFDALVGKVVVVHQTAVANGAIKHLNFRTITDPVAGGIFFWLSCEPDCMHNFLLCAIADLDGLNCRCPSSVAGACGISISGRMSQPNEIPADNQANLEATIHRARRSSASITSKRRAVMALRKCSSAMFCRNCRARKLSFKRRSRPKATAKEFLETFETIDQISEARLRRPARHCTGSTIASCSIGRLKKGGCLEAARQVAEGRARSAHWFFHARDDRCHSARRSQTDEFDYINLHWYFVNRPELAGGQSRDANMTWACSSSARMTRAENFMNRRRSWSICARR